MSGRGVVSSGGGELFAVLTSLHRYTVHFPSLVYTLLSQICTIICFFIDSAGVFPEKVGAVRVY